MKNKIFSCIALFAFCNVLQAKELKYPVSAIPATLKENAHTVIRVYNQEVEIKSEKSATVSVTEVRTILNKNGETDGYFMETYDPMNKISNIKGWVYDETGKQIRSLSYDDLVDHSAISGFSLYEDNRVKFWDPKNQTYPYTVEYTYQIDLKQTFGLPSWSHGSEYTSYENSTFVVKVPAGYDILYKEYNLPKGVIKTTVDEKDIYTWSLNNLKARMDEPMSSIFLPEYPMVVLKSKKFVVGETKGSSESWKDLGIWKTSLLETRDKLPESTIAKLKEITASCSNDFEKVKKIYEYMQLKTRYVSIQEGIGGWQPFPAEIVDKNSYGDCKALSNYTKALLSVIGIKSYYIWVKEGADENNIDVTFPSNQFNHAMVCVPLEKDTIWLECTNQRMPCGYNGDFTDDRQVLLIDGENSRLVHTRAYSASENCINRTTKVQLADIESGNAESNTHYIGLCYDDIMPIYFADDANKEKLVTEKIKLPSFLLEKFLYKENRSKTPSFDENLKLSFTNYIHKMGDIALLPVNFMNKLTSIPEKVRNRKSDMCIRRPYMENDTVIYELPEGYHVTALPEKFGFSGKFGNYSATTTQNKNEITYIRHFELVKGEFPAEAYTEFRDYLEQISSADEAVVSLKKTGF